MNIRAGFVSSYLRLGITSSIVWINMSTFTSWWADIGMIGAFSAIDPFTKSRIWRRFSFACSSVTMSILFWTMMTLSTPMIERAIRCSFVWGCGTSSFAAITRRAPSMIAAPLSIVAIRVSWPGESTKLTARRSSVFVPSYLHTSFVE